LVNKSGGKEQNSSVGRDLQTSLDPTARAFQGQQKVKTLWRALSKSLEQA